MQTILMDYADDAQMLTARGTFRVRAGVEAFYSQALLPLPGAQIAAKYPAWHLEGMPIGIGEEAQNDV